MFVVFAASADVLVVFAASADVLVVMLEVSQGHEFSDSNEL